MANPHQGFGIGPPPPDLRRWITGQQLQGTQGPSAVHAVSSNEPISRPLTFETALHTQPPTPEELRVIRSASHQPGPRFTPRFSNFKADPLSIPMPYNNTAIPPSEEVTGSAALPLARVKRILHLDDDIQACQNNAAFAITVATELFIRYIAEQSLNVVKSERKPRRNIQYRDVANAVSRIDNLEFLCDVVPKTVTYREYKQNKAARAARKKELQNGQTTLDSSRSLPKRPSEVIDVDEEVPEQQDESIDPPTNGHVELQAESPRAPPQTNGDDGPMEYNQTNGESYHDSPHHDDSHHGDSDDVEMG